MSEPLRPASIIAIGELRSDGTNHSLRAPFATPSRRVEIMTTTTKQPARETQPRSEDDSAEFAASFKVNDRTRKILQVLNDVFNAAPSNQSVTVSE